MWNVLITTDTPVVLFSFLSVLAYVQGLRRRSVVWHVAAGLLLGMAFLGKYFAALLGFAYAAHVLLGRRDGARWLQFSALTVAALLGPAYNLWWNSEHCWVNVLFNFYNRHDKAGFEWQNPLLYFASLAYLATPWVLWRLWRDRRAWHKAAYGDVALRALPWLAGVPLLLFFAMAFGKSVGLHWLLAFMPLLAVLAAVVSPPAALQRLLHWSAGFALLHALLALVLLAMPVTTWQKTTFYPGLVLTMRGAEMEKALREPLAHCGEGCELAMESYSSAATLAYATARPVIVFGEGSFHARQDDLDTDLRALDGRDLLLLAKTAPDPAAYAPYFRALSVSSFEVAGATFHLVHGQGFNYAVYHDRVLTRVRERFYRLDKLPAFLPQRGCIFIERYFSETVTK